ncbi:MAG: ABC transporter ATP-binding protein [Rhodospirillales bacterium]|nr:ABC transporter ATP-binding protein [Rhodospirillales bacterium]
MAFALDVNGLCVTYGGAIQALHGVSLHVAEGGFTALVGANGAGKSTLLKCISGLLPFEGGRVTGGSVRLFGDDVTGVAAHDLARRGLLHVREGRCVFPTMTVEDNLMAATFALGGRAKLRGRGRFDEIYAYFPQLAGRRRVYAGLLSGGEQQMLAVGRALAGAPRMLLVDEASLGLAPLIARAIFDILTRINRERGLAVLVVEQNVALALRHVSYGYVLESGRITLEGAAADLADREAISSRYLGRGASGRTWQ